jgi:hypothetical protein
MFSKGGDPSLFLKGKEGFIKEFEHAIKERR